VNESDLYFTPVGESIRFGLAAIKNVGENTAKAIRGSRTGKAALNHSTIFANGLAEIPEQAGL